MSKHTQTPVQLWETVFSVHKPTARSWRRTHGYQQWHWIILCSWKWSFNLQVQSYPTGDASKYICRTSWLEVSCSHSSFTINKNWNPWVLNTTRTREACILAGSITARTSSDAAASIGTYLVLIGQIRTSLCFEEEQELYSQSHHVLLQKSQTSHFRINKIPSSWLEGCHHIKPC